MGVFRGMGRLVQPFEAVVIGVTAIALAVVFLHHDAFELFVAFVAQHESWQLDELFFLILFGGVAALVIAIRRARDLQREMSRREAAEARALTLARHDPLTGLANRRVLQEELPDLIDQTKRLRRECAVMVIDLDQFKPINDVHGHDAGDAVLVEVARRLERAAGTDAILARTGGDEFVAVVQHRPGADAPARIATQLIRMLSAPYEVKDRKLEIGATVGIARCPVDAIEGEKLMRAADVAMYEAKRAGRGCYRFFDTGMDDRLRARNALETGLRGAIEGGEVVPYFQPVISLVEQRIIGFEALARWDHPELGLIGPDIFVPIAEDLGLIDALTAAILRESSLAARDWPPDTTLSINISPLQLRDSWLGARLLAILAETGFSPRRLIVEVTENAIIDDIEQAECVFQSLQNAGIRVALDDFGRGYSSLSHLRQLKFNHLKIDSSFVRSLDSEESQKIVSAVAGLGRAMGMPVTAEGVETHDVADALRRIGCEQAQGYLFGLPVTAQAAAALMDGERKATRTHCATIARGVLRR